MTIGGGGGGGKPISISSTSTATGSLETTTQPDTITTRKQLIYRRHFRPFIIHYSLLQ
jgi:hypothetical protein